MQYYYPIIRECLQRYDSSYSNQSYFFRKSNVLNEIVYTNGGQTAALEPHAARGRKFCGSCIES